jgi:hypothetical protein
MEGVVGVILLILSSEKSSSVENPLDAVILAGFQQRWHVIADASLNVDDLAPNRVHHPSHLRVGWRSDVKYYDLVSPLYKCLHDVTADKA